MVLLVLLLPQGHSCSSTQAVNGAELVELVCCRGSQPLARLWWQSVRYALERLAQAGHRSLRARRTAQRLLGPSLFGNRMPRATDGLREESNSRHEASYRHRSLEINRKQQASPTRRSFAPGDGGSIRPGTFAIGMRRRKANPSIR